MTSPPLSYTAERVRQFDRDRFLTALFAPPDRRESLFALYAFNIEVASVRELVSEPLLGHMRLQWWRDTLDDILAGRPGAHPVAGPLAEAARLHGLTRGPFERLLEARAQDLDDLPFGSLDALEEYAEATSASLTALALEVLGAGGQPAAEAGRHVGIAWALTGLLRAIPFHARTDRLMLPTRLLEEHEVDRDSMLAGRSAPGLEKVVAAIAERASHHLALARARRREVGRRALPALLPAVLASRHLKAMRRSGFQVLSPGWSGQGGAGALTLAALLRRY